MVIAGANRLIMLVHFELVAAGARLAYTFVLATWLPGGHPGLAEVPVAGRELPQVRQRELRD